ncbi:MAG: hypothetical protein HS114_34910 [Anaerolineales bacterium]|nr:hypothetical protein [Anaerolineales bacterium]
MKRKVKPIASAGHSVSVNLNVYEISETEILFSENEPGTVRLEYGENVPLVSVYSSASLSKEELISALDRLKAELQGDEIE